MSVENMELVRRLYAATPALRDGDPADDQAWLDHMFRDFFDADLAFRLPADYPEGARVLRGREGMIAFLAMLRDAWSEWRFVTERFVDVGDRVLVFVRVVAVGHESGVPIELESAHIWSIRDGRVTSMRIYRDRSKALEAVGLRERMS
jgi:ketosteroid isomerase-like protein